jgi:undecaprenyl-diphosphatase
MTQPPPGPGLSNNQALEELLEADVAVFGAVAGWNTPFLDTVMPPLSNAANNSVLWLGTATVIAALGGRRGRLIAAQGLVAVGLTSAIANLAAKNLVHRTRPTTSVPEQRRLEQPDSSSFPSGHTASAAAFSSVIGNEITPLLVPINVAAAAVGFSRVYTGVHYPGDVLFGWILGRVVSGAVRTVWPKKWH